MAGLIFTLECIEKNLLQFSSQQPMARKDEFQACVEASSGTVDSSLFKL